MPEQRGRDGPAHHLVADLGHTGGHVLGRTASAHRTIIAFADGGKDAAPGGGRVWA